MDDGFDVDSENFDWYALIDRIDNQELLEQFDQLSKEELKIFCINLIRGWAYEQKQNEIRNEQFYNAVIHILNE
jgi:hypothetical protein